MRESREALLLGAVGAARGIYREVIQPEITAERAWAGLISGIVLYEAVAPQNHLLSEGVDRMIDKHPVATRAVIGYTALHLCNAFEIHPVLKKIDIFSKIGKLGQ